MSSVVPTVESAVVPAGRKAPLAVRLWWWLSNDRRHQADLDPSRSREIDWLRVVPFIGLHLASLLIVEVGVSAAAVVVAVGLYLSRMFFVTAFYHRYFSHRAFSAGRVMQFVMAILGATAGQRGPLWWAAHHRDHHLKADSAHDPHSPAHCGVLFSHTLWFLTRGSFHTRTRRVRDWMKYPELRLLEKLDWLPFVLLGAGCYALGAYLEVNHPALDTNGSQMLVVGFFVSTVVLYHATYSINSIAHRFGTRRFPTGDESRNNFWLALVTLGEGWHNNHHYYSISARQGFRWWELDLTYLILKVLAAVGVVGGLRPVPERVLAAARARGVDAG